MFDEFLSGFSKFATPQRLLILIIFVVLAWLLLSYADDKSIMMDGMATGEPTSGSVAASTADNSVGAPVAVDSRTSATPSELLPADQHSQWAALNPVDMSQGSILGADMLQAGFHIGLDTIGQTLKNANQQLRSDPIIPKQTVGPWNQSTFEPDYARVPLEIGACSA